MYSWQINHINKHLVKLQDYTKCNARLLAFLESKNVLTKEEIEGLNRQGESQHIQRASELYSLIPTRLKGYEFLVKGLFDNHQSAALEILLEGYEENKIYNPFQKCNIKLDIADILPRCVMFQSNQSPLSDFFLKLKHSNEFWLQYLGGSDYCKLVYKNAELVLFSNTVPNLKHYYVKRCVRKQNHNQTLNIDVFKKQCQDVFVIKGVTRAKLTELGSGEQTCQSNDLDWESPLFDRFILLQDDSHFDKICTISGTTTHLIHCESGVFKLISSHNGTIDSTFIIKSEPLSLDEEQLVDLWKSTTETEHILLSDSPGMGKTALMVCLAQKIMSSTTDVLVIFVRFDEFCKTLTMPAISFDEIWEKLLKIGCKSYFGRKLLTELNKALIYKTFLFIDGFDEVLPKHNTLRFLVLRYISEKSDKMNIKIIISTRPHHRAIFEQTYGFTYYTLVPFQEDDQPECIISYWEKYLHITRNSKIEKFAKSCLEILKIKSNRKNEEPVAGLPLLCRLLAQVYQGMAEDQAKSKSNRSVEKLEWFGNKVIGLYKKLFELRLRDFSSIDAESIHRVHYRYAVELLFPDWVQKLENYFVSDANEDTILHAGILEKPMDRMRFVHITYADYSLAQFLTCILNDTNTNQIDGYVFISNSVFKTQGYSDELGDKVLTSFKFVHQDVCYFMNELITPEILKKTCAFDGSLVKNFDLCFDQLCAAVSSNYLNMFSLIRKMYLPDNPDNALVQLYKSQEKNWTKLAIFAAKCSNKKLLEKCLELLKDMHIQISESLLNSVVITTVKRGDYSIFEFATIPFREKENILEEFTSFLRNCVRNTNSSALAEKMNILDCILNFHTEPRIRLFGHGKMSQILLDQEDAQGQTAVFEPNIHIEILLYLAKNDTKITTRRNVFQENIVDRVAKYLSPDDLHKFLTLDKIQDCLLDLLEMKNDNGDTALHVIVVHLDPLKKTIEMITNLPGFDINHFHDQGHSLFKTAVEFQRGKGLLEQLVSVGGSMNSFLKTSSEYGNEIYFALKSGNMQAVEFFVERGVNLYQRNKEGETLWEFAKRLCTEDQIPRSSLLKFRDLIREYKGDEVKLDLLPVSPTQLSI